MKYELVYDKAGTYLGQAAHYPVFVESELQDKGYVTMVRILHTGGSRNVEQTEGSKEIHIRGAKAVWIWRRRLPRLKWEKWKIFRGESTGNHRCGVGRPEERSGEIPYKRRQLEL